MASFCSATGWLTFGVLLSLSVRADIIYKCERDGQTTFSQHACASDAEEIEEDDLSGLTGAGGEIAPAAIPIDEPPDVEPVDPQTSEAPEAASENASTGDTESSSDAAADHAEISRQIQRLEADAERRIADSETSRKRCIVELANNPPEDPDVNPNVLLQECRNRWTRVGQKIRLETDAEIKALRASMEADNKARDDR